MDDLHLGETVEVKFATLEGELPTGVAWVPAAIVGLHRTSLHVEFPVSFEGVGECRVMAGDTLALDAKDRDRTWRRREA